MAQDKDLNPSNEAKDHKEIDIVTSVVLDTPELRPSAQVQVQTDVSKLPTGEQMEGTRAATELDEARQRRDEAGDPFADTSVQLGTSPAGVEAFAEQTRGRRALPRRAREEGLPERTALQSPSEQVRDRASQPGRPVDMRQELDIAGRATGQATGRSTQRVADIATGREKGFIGTIAEHAQMDLGGNAAVLDALLEAINLPSTITGEALAEDLKRHGVDPAIADNIGLAVSVGTTLGYGCTTVRKLRKRKLRKA